MYIASMGGATIMYVNLDEYGFDVCILYRTFDGLKAKNYGFNSYNDLELSYKRLTSNGIVKPYINRKYVE